MTIHDFSFAEHALEFDEHIGASIPGYDQLCWWTEKLSRRFVQNGTKVVDIGCATGALMKNIRDTNQCSRPSVEYLGIDIERDFEQHWRNRRQENLQFEVRDVLAFDGLENMSLAMSVFTLQFIPERHKMGLLQRVYDGLVEGGALMIAEKTLAADSTLQELITFAYYDYKRQTFTAEQVLDKERRLRGLMTPWTRARMVEALCSVGFQPQNVESFWQEGPFIAFVAQKRTVFRYSKSVRPRLIAA